MDPMFQFNQSMQTAVMALGVASLNEQKSEQLAALKAEEERLRLKEEAEKKADWESRIHFIFNVGDNVINFDPHACSVTIKEDKGRITFFDEETKKKLVIGYDSESFANGELDKIYAGTEYRLNYFHLTELKYLGVDYFKLIKAEKEEKEYNAQLNAIDNKFKRTVSVHSDSEISFAENETHKKIAEHDTDIYKKCKKCNLGFLWWSIGTSVVGLIGLMILLFVDIDTGIALLAMFGVISFIVVVVYAITRGDIKKEKMQFTKILEDELCRMKSETRVQISDQENYEKEIEELNKKYANRQYYLDWSAKNAK